MSQKVDVEAVLAAAPGHAAGPGPRAQEAMADPAVSLAVGVMVAARQLYAVAHAELSDAVAAAGHDPDVAEVLSAAAAERPSAFDTVNLLRGLAGTVVPWLHAVVDRLGGEEREARKQEQEAAETLRRSRPVRLAVSELYGALEVGRGEPLVVFGEAAHLRWVFDQFGAHASRADGASPASCVVRLAGMASVPEGAPRDSSHYVRLAPAKWGGCCRSRDGLARLYRESVLPRLLAPADLLLADDLFEATTAGLPGTRLAEAFRRCSEWAGSAGAAVAAGVAVGPGQDQARLEAVVAGRARVARVTGDPVNPSFHRIKFALVNADGTEGYTLLWAVTEADLVARSPRRLILPEAP